MDAHVNIKALEDFESAYGGLLRRVRAGLGVTSFGISVIQVPPNFTGHPEHDHRHDGQEEVYLVLEGSAVLRVEGEERVLVPNVFARVGAEVKRKLLTRDEPATILLLGGSPGAVYLAPLWTEEGSGEIPSDEERRRLRRAQLSESPDSRAAS